jgi:hypothetical protein
MSDRPESSQARRWPWWAVFLALMLGMTSFRLLSEYFPPLSDAGRQTFVAIAAILIAGFLTYSIYRFVRM